MTKNNWLKGRVQHIRRLPLLMTCKNKDPLRTDVDLTQNGTRGHTPAQRNQMISNGVNHTTMGRHTSNTGIPVGKNAHDTSVAPWDHRQQLSLDSWWPPSNGQTVADILSGPTDVHFDGDDDLFHPHVNPIMNPRDNSMLEMVYNGLDPQVEVWAHTPLVAP
ncbi:hypothetical protein BU17DRAFT_70806 [Hysterangium stoloniferum]|nr:hypothetical protein BU17DRAFT_70806 [Hysterangium stoloniferum]